MISVLMLVSFITLIMAGLPVAFSLLLPSMTYIIITGTPLHTLAHRMTYGINSFIFLAAPLFIWAGHMMNEVGATERIFKIVNLSIGKLRGGTAQANIVASLIFSGMSGAALADIGGLGRIELAAMEKAGYEKPFSVAVTAASATIGPIFPPSVPLIILGGVIRYPVLQLMLGGVLPGLLMALVLMLFVGYLAVKNDLPRTYGSERLTLKTIYNCMPSFLLPVILLLGFFRGVFSPSEAGIVAVIYALFLAVLYRESSLSSLFKATVNAAKDTTAITIIVSSAATFSYVLTVDGFTAEMTNFILGLTENPMIFLFIMVFFLIIVGMFMETISSMILIAPLFLPAARMLGVDIVHFGVVMVLALMMGLITPPYGLSIFMLTRISGLSYQEVVRSFLLFYIPLFLVIILTIIFPSLVTWGPALLNR